MASSTYKIILIVFILSEIHNSCSYLEERSKIITITQKRQNTILSVVLKIHRRRNCANPVRRGEYISYARRIIFAA